MDKRIRKYWQGDLDRKGMKALLADLERQDQEETITKHMGRDDDDAEGIYPEKAAVRQGLEKLHRKLDPVALRRINRWSRMRPILKIAASILVILGLGLFFAQNSSNNANDTVEPEITIAQDDITLPSDSLPSLQLPDGEIVNISLAAGRKNNGIEVIQEADGSISYRVTPDHIVANHYAEAMKLARFSSPKGYSTRIVLMDGTKITLNSSSSIEYPLAFVETRHVKLHGEGYFEVAHDAAKPFFVETERGTVKVLGTTFNIACYPLSKDMTTTLVDGSIELRSRKQQLLLSPGQQIVLDDNDKISSNRYVDVTEYTSWKDGYFTFSDLRIAQILERVANWYDIQEIDYKRYPEDRITGTFKQTKSLKNLLDKIQEISDITFTIKERRVMVQ